MPHPPADQVEEPTPSRRPAFDDKGFRARHSSPATRAAVGVALVLVGLAGVTVASSQPQARAEVAGGNLPINASAASFTDVSAHNSPAVVQNPRRPAQLAVANRVDYPAYSCALHVSSDGGATWAPVEVPFPAGEELPARCYAPDLAFDAAGTLYMTFVTLKGAGNVPNAVWLVTSDDGGRNLSEPSKVLDELAFQVRLVADASAPGHVHLSWLDAREAALYALTDVGNPVMLQSSTDGGRSWSKARRVSSPKRLRVVAPVPSVDDEGNLYVLYLDLRDDRLDYLGGHEGKGGPPYDGRWQLVLARSGDGGETWRETTVDDAVVPTERFIVFIPPAPSLVVDPRGERVHVAFHDGRLGDADAWVWTSRDGGASFLPPVRVNDTPARDGTTQHLPRLGLAADGRLDVLYYDRRTDPDDELAEVSLQASFDGGETFDDRLVMSDRAFSYRFAPGDERGLPDLGTRLGLLTTARRALAVWADTRASAEHLTKQDLSRAVAFFTPASSLRGPMRTAGGVALTGGVVVLLSVVLTLVRARAGDGVRPPTPRRPRDGTDELTPTGGQHA